MNGNDRLKDKIARLMRPVETTAEGWRVLSAGDADALLALLLREIAETVLPRTLVVEIEPQAQALIAVANGRVLALETAEGAVTGADGHAGNREFAVALAASLSRFAGGAVSLRLRSAAPGASPSPADLRCPAARVAELLQPRHCGADGLRALVAALGADVIAWRRFDAGGRPGAGGGAAPDLAGLTGFAAAQWDAIGGVLASAAGDPARPACLILGAGGDTRLVCASMGADRVLLRATAAAEAHLGAIWQDILGRGPDGGAGPADPVRPPA